MGTEGDLFNAALGRQLRAEIAAAGKTIAGTARAIGVARSALDNYVTGKRAIPVSVAYEIAAYLGIDPHTLVVRAEDRLSAERHNVIAFPRRSNVGAPVETPLEGVARPTDPEPTDEQ